MYHRLNRSRSDAGQALVELALVLPLVLLLLFAIIDFGLALNDYNGDTNVANLAARTASVLGSASTETCSGVSYSTLTAWVDCEAVATGAPTPSVVCVKNLTTGTASPTAFAVGDSLQVEVGSSFAWFSLLTGGDGYIGSIRPTTTLTAGATMRVEQAISSSNAFFPATICP
ncbi:MAG: TadE/TadG family type IV pilus assembly protein [Solirubrobacteraceae bacterium]